jgi:coatomer protein complex subunit alpha (xenin)
MSIELARRSLVQGAMDISGVPEDTRKRALELSAYFTIPELEGSHKWLPLNAAMNFANKNKQLKTALRFAEALEGANNAKMRDGAKRVKTVAERNPSDALEIDFDEYEEFEICAASYTPIKNDNSSVACPYDGSKYHSKYKGTVCKICEVCQLGAPATGLRLVG